MRECVILSDLPSFISDIIAAEAELECIWLVKWWCLSVYTLDVVRIYISGLHSVLNVPRARDISFMSLCSSIDIVVLCV